MRWCPATFSTAVVRRSFSQISPIYPSDFSCIVPNSSYRWSELYSIRFSSRDHLGTSGLFLFSVISCCWVECCLALPVFFSGNINNVGMKWTLKWTRRQNNLKKYFINANTVFFIKMQCVQNVLGSHVLSHDFKPNSSCFYVFHSIWNSWVQSQLTQLCNALMNFDHHALLRLICTWRPHQLTQNKPKNVVDIRFYSGLKLV